MAQRSKIEWTDATWNAITGCSVVSPGCTNCYAMRMAGTRLKDHPSRKGLTIGSKAGPVWTGEVRLNEDWLMQPLRWPKPRVIFVCAHGDLFHEAVPEHWIDRVFAVMALAPQHTFQVLTKRSARMRAYFESEPQDRISGEAGTLMHWDDMPQRDAGPLSNVWLGVSAEDQARADERIPDLLATPAAVRFVSAEPLLGPVDLTQITTSSDGYNLRLNAFTGIARHTWHKNFAGGGHDPGQAGIIDSYQPGLDWVIVGGESGRGARPMHPAWARSLRDQCQQAARSGATGADKTTGVPFFFKQWGAWGPWEPEAAPYWRSPNGKCVDRHVLFPADFDKDRNWDDGLWAVAGGWDHVVFQRVGKTAAGALLDGREWREMPAATTAGGRDV